MQNNLLLYHMIVCLTILSSCGNRKPANCETIQEWQVQSYKIVKSRCPDMVLAFYYGYSVYVGERQIGGVSQVDSCIFTGQYNNECFVTLNVCNNTIQELRPHKNSLDVKTIDSITIFSNQEKQTQLLSGKQIEKFVDDWNNSKTRGYSTEPFDSAFSLFPGYQYRLTVFSKGTERPFYGYNYLVLDSSNWKFEMSKSSELKYFHEYWKR